MRRWAIRGWHEPFMTSTEPTTNHPAPLCRGCHGKSAPWPLANVCFWICQQVRFGQPLAHANPRHSARGVKKRQINKTTLSCMLAASRKSLFGQRNGRGMRPWLGVASMEAHLDVDARPVWSVARPGPGCVHGDQASSVPHVKPARLPLRHPQRPAYWQGRLGRPAWRRGGMDGPISTRGA